MSHWDESYEDRYARRRDEQREYHSDVFYEVWRAGGNPDRVSYERVDNAFYDGRHAEEAAGDEIRRQRQQREQAEQAEQEQQHLEEYYNQVHQVYDGNHETETGNTDA